QVAVNLPHFQNLSKEMHCAFTATGEFAYVTSASKHLLGYTPEELIGKSYKDFLFHLDIQKERARWGTEGWNGQVRHTHNHYVRKDGSFAHLQWTVQWQPQEQLIYAVVKEVSQTHEAALKLQEEVAKYRALLENGYDMVYIVSGQGEYKFVSESVTRILGYSQQELLGRNGYEYIHPDDLAFCQNALRLRIEGHEVPSEPFRFRAADGTYRWLQTTISNQLHNPVVQGVVLKSRDITEKILAEQRLQEEKQRYQSLFANHPDAVFSIDHQATILAVNKAGCHMLQQPEESLVQQSFMQFIHPKQQKYCRKLFARSLDGTAQYLDITYLNQAEKRVDISLTLIPVHVNGKIEGVYAVARDISEAKHTERELKKLSLVASKVKNVIVITDSEGKIEWVNEAFVQETGFTLAEVQGKVPGHALSGPETEMEAHQRINLKLLETQELVREEVLRYNKDGSRTWCHLELSPILSKKGKLQRVISVTTDVTEIKQAQQEKIRLTEDLLRQNKDLAQFGFIVSHNLRAPVANILGLTHLLPKHLDSPEASSKIIENLKGASQHLDTVIRDLNQILTVRQEVVELKEQINLQTEVQSLLNSLRQQTEACGVTISLDFAGGTEVYAVRSYVTSILQNLLTNAIKYRSPRRPLLVQISTLANPEYLCLSMADNGLGIDLDKEKDNLFKLYKRFHFHTEGKGMGLHLAKTQIEALGGKITVESTPQAGTTFTVWFKR
ncbi:MAG: PAS domain-containing sensor histidine kinase, partial [Rufibacter sp.]